jgi:signal transduction histidine kinase
VAVKDDSRLDDETLPPSAASSEPPSRSSRASSRPPALLDASPDERRSEFLRSVSHELRTPLNVILGFTDILLAEIDGPITGDQRENLTIVRDSGKRLLVLVNDVIELSAVVPEEDVEAGDPVTVLSLLENVQLALEERRGVRPVHVGVTFSPALEGYTISNQTLGRAFSIFAEHALVQTESGEVRLSASLERGALRLSVSGDGLRFENPGGASVTGPIGAAGEASVRASDQGRNRGNRATRLRLRLAEELVKLAGARLEMLRGASAATSGANAASEQAPPGAFVLWPSRASSQSGAHVLRGPAGAFQTAAKGTLQKDVHTLRVQWLAAMGHDLRSPLNAMLGFADLVAIDPHAQLSAAQTSSLEIVRERARDLLALIDDMVDWAKLAGDELKLSFEKLDARELIERAVEDARQRSGARELVVLIEAEPELGRVFVDARRSAQALVALMDHGVRSPEGGLIVLYARREEDDDGKPQLLIEVHDASLEIRESDREHLFTAFRPSFAPTGKRIAGLSLGTAIARALVRAQGGDVWFASRPERGTTFAVSLPSHD